MPATSLKQKRFFQWAEHNPAQAAAEGKAPKMSTGQMHDYSATPAAGLPAGLPAVAPKPKRRKYYGEIS